MFGVERTADCHVIFFFGSRHPSGKLEIQNLSMGQIYLDASDIFATIAANSFQSCKWLRLMGVYILIILCTKLCC